MEQTEPLAAKVAELESGRNADLSRELTEFWITQHAALYRKTIGVPMSRRGELKAALEQIAQTGAGCVDGVIAGMQQEAVGTAEHKDDPSSPVN